MTGARRACGGPAETRGDTRRRPSAQSHEAEGRGTTGSQQGGSSGVQDRGWEVARPEDGHEACREPSRTAQATVPAHGGPGEIPPRSAGAAGRPLTRKYAGGRGRNYGGGTRRIPHVLGPGQDRSCRIIEPARRAQQPPGTLGVSGCNGSRLTLLVTLGAEAERHLSYSTSSTTHHCVMSTPVSRRGRLRRQRSEEDPTSGEPGGAGPVAEEPEVADPDETAGEDVQEEAAEELLARRGHRLQAVPPGIVFRPVAHLVRVHADESVIGGGHAVRVPPERSQDRGETGEGPLG